MLAVWREALNRRDFFSGDLGHGNLAGAYCLAVDVNGAGAAKTGATAEFGARQLQMLAQHPKQRRVGLRLDVCRFAVDCKCCCSHAFSPSRVVLLSLIALDPRISWPPPHPCGGDNSQQL